MAKLLMISGVGSTIDLASGKRGAFYNTLEEFSKHWERIDIIAPKVQFSIFNFQFSNNTKILFGNVFIHISPWPLIFYPIWFLKKGIQIYKEQKFDLMTVHEFPPFYNGIGARLLWQRTKVPYVLEIHHVPGYPKVANLKEKIYRSLMSWFIKFDASRAATVRVVNKKQTSEFLIKAGVPENKIIYIPSVYIDLDIFKPMNLEKKYDLIFVGRLEKNKGINLLLEASRELKIKSGKLKVLIVGDGHLKENLKLKIKNLELQDIILLYGWAKDSSEIAQLINESKILVMPSYNEGGPRVVVEALACGVPVLATPVGIVPDLLKNNQGGDIIDWNSENIAEKARKLLNDSIGYAEYSLNCVEIAKQFEKKEAIRNYADKLKAVLN